MRKKYTLAALIFSILSPLVLFSQVSLFSNYRTRHYENLKYYAAYSEPDPSWYKPEFDDSAWTTDSAVVGFGYGDEGYRMIDPSAKSLYVRFFFNVADKAKIKCIDFAADFDDGFIAYLNGVEIARVNADENIQFPPYNTVAIRSHQAEFLKSASQITRPNGIYLDSATLANCLVDGENIVAVHIINDTIGDDLFFAPYVIDLSNVTYQTYNYADFTARYLKPEEVDSTDLPLIVIETDQNGITYDQRNWTTARMGIVNNGTGKFNKPTDPYNEYNGLINIRTRGQSSRDFAKKSYRIELVDEELSDTSLALLGMPKESDWILFGPFADKSQVRNKLAYNLATRMGNYAPRTRFCEVIMNGQSQGLYILTEQIKRDKNRVDVSKLKETDISGMDVTGGYIFKYDKADVFPKGSVYVKGREIVYPDAPTTEQANYLKRFFTSYDSLLLKTNDFNDPAKGFRKYASDTSLVDFIIINELVKNPDGYIYSTYMYKDRDDKDGRIKFGPIWDCDIAFGNSIFQEGNLTSGWQFNYNANNKGMYLTRYFQDTKFVKLFQDRWHELRAKTLSNDSIFNMFHQLVDDVQLARERNYEIWPVIDKNIFWQGYKALDYESELASMEDWLLARLSWIDENIDKIYYPLKVVGTDQLASGNVNIQAFPNPFEEQLTLRFNSETESTVSVKVYDMTGQLKYESIPENIPSHGSLALSDPKLASLGSGLYVARVIINGTVGQSLKIIKK
ncbi:MAG TPA: CotH kinase family protein [Prolixibacteraceae bacterium]|nr:CotH kinase family protein [Prolixibacteraceae bacterium]